MRKTRPIIVRTDNPFYHPVFRGDGSVFIPTGPPRVVAYDRGAVRWNPVYWSRRLAPRDRAVIVVGLHATRGSRQWPKSSRIPGRLIADKVSDFRSKDARAGGASVVSQFGRWFDAAKGRIVRERSVSVTVLREPNETWASFKAGVRRLAEQLCHDMGQHAVYVDYIRGGRLAETRKAYWRARRATRRQEERL